LRPDQPQSFFGDPVGLAARGLDGPQLLQPAEEIEIDAGIEPAIAGEATDCLDLPVVVARNFDAAALGHEMQDALLRARNVHVLRSGIAPGRAHKNDLAFIRTSGLRFFRAHARKKTCGQGLYRVSGRLNIKHLDKLYYSAGKIRSRACSQVKTGRKPQFPTIISLEPLVNFATQWSS